MACCPSTSFLLVRPCLQRIQTPPPVSSCFIVRLSGFAEGGFGGRHCLRLPARATARDEHREGEHHHPKAWSVVAQLWLVIFKSQGFGQHLPLLFSLFNHLSSSLRPKVLSSHGHLALQLFAFGFYGPLDRKARLRSGVTCLVHLSISSVDR